MTGRGVLVSLISSLAFAGFSYVAALAAPLDGVQIWGWRILLTVPGILVLLAVSGRWFWFSGELKRAIAAPKKFLGYLFTVPMLASQMWLFGWAPQTGNTLALAMGYFLMPLVMVVIGRVFFKEKLTAVTWLATGVAAASVIYEVFRAGGLTWVTAYIAFGYPFYFVVRRILETDGVGALTWEMTLALPLAGFFAVRNDGLEVAFRSLPAVMILLVVGVLSIVGMVTYVMAAKLLPYALFGLLSYVEPVLVTGVAWLLGERITGAEWITYIGIWAAIVILSLDGINAMLRRRKWAVPAVRPWRRRRPRKSKNEKHSWRRFKPGRGKRLIDPGQPAVD